MWLVNGWLGKEDGINAGGVKSEKNIQAFLPRKSLENLHRKSDVASSSSSSSLSSVSSSESSNKSEKISNEAECKKLIELKAVLDSSLNKTEPQNDIIQTNGHGVKFSINDVDLEKSSFNVDKNPDDLINSQ